MLFRSTNPNCKEQLISRLAAGIGTFGLENVGGATIDKLYHAGIKQISDLFDKSCNEMSSARTTSLLKLEPSACG